MPGPSEAISQLKRGIDDGKRPSEATSQLKRGIDDGKLEKKRVAEISNQSSIVTFHVYGGCQCNHRRCQPHLAGQLASSTRSPPLSLQSSLHQHPLAHTPTHPLGASPVLQLDPTTHHRTHTPVKSQLRTTLLPRRIRESFPTSRWCGHQPFSHPQQCTTIPALRVIFHHPSAVHVSARLVRAQQREARAQNTPHATPSTTNLALASGQRIFQNGHPLYVPPCSRPP